MFIIYIPEYDFEALVTFYFGIWTDWIIFFTLQCLTEHKMQKLTLLVFMVVFCVSFFLINKSYKVNFFLYNSQPSTQFTFQCLQVFGEQVCKNKEKVLLQKKPPLTMVCQKGGWVPKEGRGGSGYLIFRCDF